VERKYPDRAYRGFRARLPDLLIGMPLARPLRNAVGLLGLRPGDRVLDLSCGPGFALGWLSQAVGSGGEVLAIEDNRFLRERADAKARAMGWTNVRFSEAVDQSIGRGLDGIFISYNPPIILESADLIDPAWELLSAGRRLACVAGRATTISGRLAGPFIRLGLMAAGHPGDFHYWRVHEPWRHLADTHNARVEVETFAGFEYILCATKA
jgi:SAM-dependent methyltransferase